MPHESFEVQTVDYCKWELFQGGLWVIICSALQGAVLGTQGTAVPQESEAETEQHMLGHWFPAWNKSTGLSFISNVCDLHERTTVTQPQPSVGCCSLIDRISYFTCPCTHPLIPLPPRTTWWWLQDYSIKHIASLAAVKCNCSVFSLWYRWCFRLANLRYKL